MKKIALILIILILLPVVSAAEGHLTLLTVAETDDNRTVGGTADLTLEITPGTGRVFIDSFPLTKVDTQISTRFAKEVACDFLEVDCSDKDFFYTIRARAPIVGGPSAGAAISILTISLLEGTPLDDSTVITGTINSGGLIGPVAGIKEKAEAAQKKGFTKILIPEWSILSTNKSNSTENSTEINITYADSLEVEGIEVKTVSTLEEAVAEFTGKKYEPDIREIDIPKKYQDIMKQVANMLCSRYDEIKKDTEKSSILQMNETFNESESLLKKGKDALTTEDYYSAASYCFTANTRMRTIQFSNYSNSSLEKIKIETGAKVNAMIRALDTQTLNTMSDLETYIIVKERLYEAQNLLEEEGYDGLGYTYERMYSAVAWSEFFDYNENPVDLNTEYLERACLSKIAEAEERQSYIELLFGERFLIPDQMEDVRQVYNDEDYAFCLFKASKIKSETNAVLIAQGLTKEKFSELVDDQLGLAKAQINKQEEKFPILGYSYYNYADSLKEENPITASLFAGYSIEFSNLDMYFPSQKRKIANVSNILSFEFFVGFMLGIFVSFIFLFVSRKK